VAVTPSIRTKKKRRAAGKPRGQPIAVTRPANHLVVGWKLDANGDPEYWVPPNRHPRPGSQPESSLVTLPAKVLGTNTIIVAQSGSGKSSFLARLVEELLLSSPARCLIIDPNSDFRYLPEVGNSAQWAGATYDPRTHSGRLFTERTAAEFKRRWKTIGRQITILSGRVREDIPSRNSTMQAPTVHWRYVPPDFQLEGLDSVHRVEMRHCHTFFISLAEVCESGFILRNPRMGPDASLDLLGIVEPIFSALAEARDADRLHGNEAVIRLMDHELGQRMQLPGGHSYSEAKSLGRLSVSSEDDDVRTISFRQIQEEFHYRRIARNLEKAAVAFGHFSNLTGRHYFGVLQDLHAAGLLSEELEDSEPRRVEVLDLPSIELHSNRYLLIASYLDRVIALATESWERARSATYLDPNRHPKRSPFFVVLDEAHNLIPGDESGVDPSLKLVRDRIRIIAAEGRKFGLYLIVATQRPDKIDKFILSECQNKAVLRLDNEAALKLVANALEMQDAEGTMRTRCLGSGYRMLLAGHWTDHKPVPMYPAPRRTMEGGGSLTDSDWAPVSDWISEGDSQ
jgi:hypothetical protein